jgi:hypothetical protein
MTADGRGKRGAGNLLPAPFQGARAEFGSHRRGDDRQARGMYLTVAEPSANVKNLVSLVAYQPLCLRTLNELKERGAISGFKPHP